MPGPDDKDWKEGEEKPWWSELVKEVAALGLGTVFMTEEAVRNYLREKKLPKELIVALAESVSKKKDEFSNLLSKELGKWLSKVDMGKEFRRFLETHHVQVRATVTFEPKNDSKGEPS